MEKYKVIYTRFSSDMQDDTSLRQQERNARRHMEKLGIDHSDAKVIEDAAERGWNAKRPGYIKLQKMIASGQVDVLVVNEQSRLGRHLPTTNFIEDLIYHGGRFISVAENIDTNQENWEINSKVSEMNSSVSNKFHAHRCRGGLEDRVLDENGSAGDYPIGYVANFLDDNWQELIGTRRRPRKYIVFDDKTMPVVQRIFAWYGEEGVSMNEICRRLNREGAPKGPKSRTKTWDVPYVAQILENTKYIGRWPWGTTKGVRHSSGKTKRLPRPEQEHTIVERPSLRIIDQALWDKAQARRTKEKGIYSKRHLDRRKQPYIHPRHMHPGHSLAGLVMCGHCGHPLGTYTPTHGKYSYFYCRNKIYGSCNAARRVRVNCVEATMVRLLRGYVAQSENWIDVVINNLHQMIESYEAEMPLHLSALNQKIEEAEEKINRLTRAVEDAACDVQSVMELLARREKELVGLRSEASAKSSTCLTRIQIPTRRETMNRLNELPATILADNTPSVASDIYGQLFEEIKIIQTVPGDARYPMNLRVKPSHIGLLRYGMNSEGWHAPGNAAMLKQDAASSDGMPEEIETQIDEPHRSYHWGPMIQQYRDEGKSWSEIGALTETSESSAMSRYRSWMETQ